MATVINLHDLHIYGDLDKILENQASEQLNPNHWSKLYALIQRKLRISLDSQLNNQLKRKIFESVAQR